MTTAPTKAAAPPSVVAPVKRLVLVDAKDDEPTRPTSVGFGFEWEKPIVLRVKGVPVRVPHRDVTAMRDLLETAYVMDGRIGVRNLEWQLATTRRVLIDPEEVARSFMPPGVSPLQLAPRGPTELGGGKVTVPPATLFSAPTDPWIREAIDQFRGELTRSDLPTLDHAITAFATANQALAERLQEYLDRVEAEANRIATAQLESSGAETLREGLRYFDVRNEDSVEALYRVASDQGMRGDKSDVKAIRKCLQSLLPAAQKVLEAKNAVASQERERDRALAAYGRAMGTMPQAVLARHTQAIDAATEQLSRDQSAFAVAIAPALRRFAVLHRFSAEDVVDGATASDTKLGHLVFPKLRRTWKAAGAVLEKFDLPATRASRIAATPRIESDLAETSDDSAWSYPKTIDAALASPRLAPLDVGPGSLALASVRELMLARRRRTAQGEALHTVLMVTELGVALALHAVCPPAGMALDVALATRDIWRSGTEYSGSADDYWCALNPNQSLAAEPSLLPLAFAIAGGVVAVAPAIGKLGKAMRL